MVSRRMQLEALTVEELKEELRKKGLKVSGAKAELVDRLLKNGGGGAPGRQAATGPSKGGRREQLEALTVEELKEKLRGKGLKVSGAKAELVDRLLEGGSASNGGSVSTGRQAAAGPGPTSRRDQLEALTVEELKEKLRKKGLKVSGAKAELVDRLLEGGGVDGGSGGGALNVTKAVQRTGNGNSRREQLEALTVEELKEKLRKKGLKVSGAKAELVDRLIEGGGGANGSGGSNQHAEPGAVKSSRRKQLEALTVEELKEKLRKKGLKVSGAKAELVDRLLEGCGSPSQPNVGVIGGAKATVHDENGRVYAETLAGKLEDIAKGYGVGPGNTLDVVVHGRMAADWKELRAQVPNKPGNYVWAIRAPKAQLWVPVYCGKAGGNSDATLRARFKKYINETTFGPENENAKKHWFMVDAMSRGFSFQCRFRTLIGDAVAAEDKTLGAYNFTLNSVKNGGIRPIQLPGGRRMEDYPVVHDDLAKYAASILYALEFKGLKMP